MPRKVLTARFVDSVKVESRTDFWDDLVRGLVLRVSETGVKTWTVIYSRESDGARQRLTLGRHPAIDLEKARSRALKALAGISEGEDPANKKRIRREAMTMRDLGALFIERYAKVEKRTWAEDERMLAREIYPAIGDMKIISIRRRDLLDIIDAKADAGRVGQSRKILALVRKLFNWAVSEDYIEASPVAGVRPKGRNGQRDRFLTDGEIRAVWQALDGAAMLPATKDVIKLLFLTGQRSGEVCGMRKSELDLSQRIWTLPGERTKNGRAHVVPLSSMALDIIEPAFDGADADDPDAALFTKTGEPYDSKSISRAVKAKLQVLDQGWTPHDARRTVATGMAGIGVQPHLIEAVLNHISGFRAGVAGIYNRNAYDQEKRGALDRWARNIEQVINAKKQGNVYILRG